VIASGNDEIYRYVIAWMADAVQHPAQRPGISLALRGLQGTGKGVFISQFGKLFGPHYKHVTHSHHLVGRFNNHFKDALIVFADETVWIGDRKAEGVLKAMVTEETMQIEPKGRDIYEVQNHIRLMVASNKDWVVPAGLEERRFCVIDVPDTHIQDEAYFKAIVEEMDHGGREALLYHLLNEVDLSNIKLRNFPRTPALFEQMVRTMEPVQRFWYNMLRRGAFYDVSSEDVYTDWPGEVRIPCPTLYEKYGDYLGKRRQKLSDTDGGEAEFGSELRKWVPPEFKRYRPSNGHGGRVYTYVIPPLA
jgi:phage/plasmid-associated DNA primase